jgi:hypothetical protein
VVSGAAAPAQTEDGNKAPDLRKALEQTVTLDFADLSLSEVTDRLRTQTGLAFVLDSALTPLLDARENALTVPAGFGLPLCAGPLPPPEGLDHKGDTLIPPGFSCRLRQMKLGAALDTLLGHYGLGYALQGNTIVIALADKASRLQRQQAVSMNVESTPLSKAIDMLGRATSVDLVLDPRCAKEAQTPITVKLQDVPLERGVQLVAGLADLKAVAVGKVFLVTTPARAEAVRAAEPKAAPVKTVRIPPQQPLGFGLGGIGLPQAKGGLGLLEVEVPAALLQKGGPAPRGPEPDRKAPKVVMSTKKAPSAGELLRKKLNEPVAGLKWDGDMTLREALEYLTKNHALPKVVIDHSAFRDENPDSGNLLDAQIEAPRVQGVPMAKLLRLLLDRVPTNNAAFLVRPDYIEITTNEKSFPENQFVEGTFQDSPLEDVLAELADRTGVTILFDARAAEKARSPVSARFQHETNLATAVRLLADMADLKLVVVDRVLYVTLRSNSAIFPPGNPPAAKRSRNEPA